MSKLKGKKKSKGAGKAVQRHGKRGQLVTTPFDTELEMVISEANSGYSPNWNKEIAEYDKYVADGGIGHKEADRHAGALRASINKQFDDLEDRAQLLSSVNPKSAKLLNYMNPWSKLLWLGAALRGFMTLNPTGPFYAMTVISKDWNRSTADNGGGTTQVKKAVQELLSGVKAHSFGHVETAVFPKVRVDGRGYQSSAHAQVIVWGVTDKDLRKALKAKYPPLEDGTAGYWVLEIEEQCGYALSYATKSPSYGYSGWPSADGSTVHKSVRLSQSAHVQLLTQFRSTTWPMVNIATGDGQKIRQSAIEAIGYEPAMRGSPLADKSKTSATEKPLALTIETGVDPTLKITSGKGKLFGMVGTLNIGINKYLEREAEGDDVLCDCLGKIYEFALTSADQELELKKVLKLHGITFNRAADLFLLAVKLATAKKGVPKQRQSEWAGGLRYLYAKRCEPELAATKLKEYGGPKECVKALKSTKAPKEQTTLEQTQDEVWDAIKANGNGFEIATNELDMPVAKGVLVAARNKDRNRLFVRHVVSVEEKRGQEFLRKLAADLTTKPTKPKNPAS